METAEAEPANRHAARRYQIRRSARFTSITRNLPGMQHLHGDQELHKQRLPSESLLHWMIRDDSSSGGLSDISVLPFPLASLLYEDKITLYVPTLSLRIIRILYS